MGKFFWLILATVFFQSTIALSQDALASGELAGVLDQWPEVGKMLALMFSIMVLLRSVAEVLTHMSAWLDTKSPAKAWLQRLAGWVSQAAWLLGVVLGKVGVGEPKLVTEEKIKAAAPAAPAQASQPQGPSVE